MNDNKKNNNDWFVSGYDSLTNQFIKRKIIHKGRNTLQANLRR